MTKKLLVIITILWHIIIFFQSSLPGDVSSQQSGLIADVIYPFIEQIGIRIPLDLFVFLIRKLAHFTEYFVLAILIYYVYKIFIKGYKLKFLVLIHGFIIASLDETLQTFIKHRSGELRDVGIDTLGVMTGILVITIGEYIYERIKQKKTISN